MSGARKAQVSTNLLALLVVAAVVITAGIWWWTSTGSQEPDPSPSMPSPTGYQSATFTGFGFSFEHPEDMVFTPGGTLGGFDHARPVFGDVLGLWEEVPEVMGVIWVPSSAGFDLETALDGAFQGVQEGGSENVSRGLVETGEKDGHELIYQPFELINEGVSQKGMVGAWSSEEDERLYLLFVTTALNVGTQEELASRWREYLDTFEVVELPPKATEIEAYWPTDGWRTAAPETVGLDSGVLDGMIEHIVGDGIGADSITVIRHGFIVSDAYFPPFDEGEIHIVYSCTKSVVSTLIGIAIDEGYIDADLDQRLLDIFPDRTVGNPSAWKSDITLRDLLMMSGGFDARDSYLYDWDWLDRLHDTDDAIQYMLDLEMAYEPGSRFEYTNGVSHLLSCIISEATGMSALEFAEEQLFEPLGITGAAWTADSQGHNWGYSSLYLTPRDMAKFGFLFLNGGEWDGEQVVPRYWVEEATSEQISAGTLLEGYGYQWWTSPDGYYSAIGYKGQFIHVVPELDLIMVTTGRVPEAFDRIQALLEEFVIPSIVD